ncbi:MAG TPA: peptidylprolyl isomerase [Lachnospiraceae bacterium]|nr:peptidylprolyl isomerase [Lachnospiraceae bacterium]
MKNKIDRHKIFRCTMIVLVTLFLFTMCACGKKGNADTKIVLTTGFGADEVFKIENKSCKIPEVLVYMTTTQNQYEEVYGEQIWKASLDGVTLEENVKETVLAKIAQIKTLNLLAESKQVELNDEEKEKVKLAATAFYESLSDTEIDLLGVTQDTIRQLYEEYALAEKISALIIKDINPEVSDDEARIITVQHILFKTYTSDGRGIIIDYTDAAKQAACNKAKEVLALATDGEHDFQTLASEYNEDNVDTYSFGKGDMTEAFEEAAFNLGMNEISKIVTDEYGYHIIKCINTFNRDETDQNKLVIVEKRKKEVFGEEYDAFVDSLNRKLNDKAWGKISFIHNENVNTSNFYDMYLDYFPDEELEK